MRQTRRRMYTIDVTKQVGAALNKAGFGDDSNNSADITKAGIWNLMDCLVQKSNRFTAEQARNELNRRGL